MSPGYKFVFLWLTLIGAQAGNVPSNYLGINNIIDIPNKIPAIPGFGSKGNGTGGEGSTTVMGNYGSIIPNIAQNIFGSNKTSDNDTSSESSSNGGNFGSIISGIPNKVFPNKTGLGTENIPDYGYISGIPNKIFGNNKTNSDNGTDSNSGNGFPNIGSIITGIPDKIFGNNKTSSSNRTHSNNFPGVGSIVPGILANKNKTSSGSGNVTSGSDSGNGSEGGTSTESGSSSNGFPDFSSYIPGLSNKKNKSCGSSNGALSSGGIPSYQNYIPTFPHNIFRSNSTNSKNNTENPKPITGLDYGSIINIPNKIWANDKENKTRDKRHCAHCGNGSSSVENEHDETRARHKRQIGTGTLGSLIPGGSNLGSIGSNLAGVAGESGDATLVLGMFQVLVKPIKTPSFGEMTDIFKNPQNILTQPQTLLNGGKS